MSRHGAFVNRTGVPRRVLAHSGHEGLIVALAGAITAMPKKGDDRLIIVTDNSQLSENAQHKIIEALIVLAKQPGLIPESQYAAVKKWVDGIADREPKLPPKVQTLKDALR